MHEAPWFFLVCFPKATLRYERSSMLEVPFGVQEREPVGMVVFASYRLRDLQGKSMRTKAEDATAPIVSATSLGHLQRMSVDGHAGDVAERRICFVSEEIGSRDDRHANLERGCQPCVTSAIPLKEKTSYASSHQELWTSHHIKILLQKARALFHLPPSAPPLAPPSLNPHLLTAPNPSPSSPPPFQRPVTSAMILGAMVDQEQEGSGIRIWRAGVWT